MIKDVIREGNPILRQIMPNAKIKDRQFISKVLDDLIDTMEATGAVGFAANQIGYKVHICIVKRWGQKPIELVNPKIIFRSGQFMSREGCFSLVDENGRPNYWAEVPRASAIHVAHRTRNGKSITTMINGAESAFAQHEIDHLNGIFIKDYVEGTNGKSGGQQYNPYQYRVDSARALASRIR